MHPRTLQSFCCRIIRGCVYSATEKIHTDTINTDKAELISSTSVSTGFRFLNCKHFDTWFKRKTAVLYAEYSDVWRLMMKQDKDEDANCESECKWIEKPGLTALRQFWLIMIQYDVPACVEITKNPNNTIGGNVLWFVALSGGRMGTAEGVVLSQGTKWNSQAFHWISEYLEKKSDP